MISSKYQNAIFLSVLCSSYIALSAPAFAADEAETAQEAPIVIKNSDYYEDQKAAEEQAVKDKLKAEEKAEQEKAMALPVKKPEVSDEDSETWVGKAVFERPREEYEGQGARLGAFKLKTSAVTSESYDSNIYAIQSKAKGDSITKIAPTVSVESDWSRHAIGLAATGEFGKYSNYTNENYDDYSAELNGRIDILRETFIEASASAAHLHEDRGSVDSRASSFHPTEYKQDDVDISFVRNLNRVSFKLSGDYRRLDYDNGEDSTGAVVLNNDRDRNEYKITNRIGYEIIPEYEAFVKGSVNERNYDLDIDAGGVNRDSEGYDVVAGTAVNLGGKTKGEVYGGYMAQDYESSALKDIGAPQFGADIIWTPSGITSVTAGIVRGVSETTIANYSSSKLTVYSLDVEHEITYNFLAGVNASYTLNNYNALDAITRTDKTTGAGAELRYLINRHSSVIGKYDYSTRDSDAINQDYDRSVVSVGVKLEM